MELTTSATFSAELKELSKMIEWVRGYLIQIGCNPLLAKKVELALEEVLVNIIKHAYQAQGGPVEIAFQGKTGSYLEIAITDKGPKFNPIEKEIPIDPSLPLEKRKEGGVGIHLMKQMVDEVQYRREKEKNILTLKKRL